MKGKDIVLFILKYDLMNTDFEMTIPDEDNEFLTVEEAAVKLGISTTSLEDMIVLGLIDHVEIDGKMYLHKDVQLAKIKRR